MGLLDSLRALMEPVLEGATMERLGPDYRNRRAAQEEALASSQELRLMGRRRADREDRQEDRADREEMNKIVAALAASMREREVGDAPAVTYQGPSGPVSVPTSDRSDVLGSLKEELGIRGQATTSAAVEQERQIRSLPISPEERQRMDLEVQGRARVAAAGRYNLASAGIDPSYIQQLADRYAGGEITYDQARASLGGVHGMRVHGPAFINAVGNRRGITPTIRKDLVGVQTTRNIVDEMETLVEKVIAAKTPAERTEATILLQQFGQTTGTLLSRGFGERGVVTDRDVARATGLVPGWKAANFNPDYARKEIALLREVLDRNEQGILSGNTAQFDRSGQRIDAPTEQTLYRYRGRDLPWDQLPPEAQARARALGKAPR